METESNVVQLPKEVTTAEYFGGCPKCGKTDGYMNVGPNHWSICDEHKTSWCIGSNLFSGWRDETEHDFERNAKRLKAEYTVVEPIYPKQTPEEEAAVFFRQQEQAMHKAFGAWGVSSWPFDKTERDPHHWYFQTEDGLWYDLDREQSWAAYAAELDGEPGVIDKLKELGCKGLIPTDYFPF